MVERQRTKRFGVGMILFACILRLSLAGVPGMLLQWLKSKVNDSFPIYSETGRDVRFPASSEKFLHHFRESPQPWIPVEEKLTFLPEDAALVEMDYDCTLRPDLEELILQPLNWDLAAQHPSVLILHTHTTESYTKNEESYEETSAYRTLDEAYNMLSVGEEVARILSDNGIGVIHDREIHDYPSYNGSYIHSRKTVETLLEQYPSICLVLDLHRDALEKNGAQIRPVMDTEDCARLMIVAGTNVSRQGHENWQENLSLALKLHIQLEKLYPGIMRPLNLRPQRFNQDLSPGAILVEIGAAGNSHSEALAAARCLAEGVLSLSKGTDHSGD